MGWLPIALALAGFVFFVAVVNQNSIKMHRDAMMMAFFHFCQTAKARHTLLRALGQIPADQPCHANHLEDDFNLRHFKAYMACIRKEQQSIEDSRMLLRMNRPADANTRKALKSLQVLNHRQHINIKTFKRKVKEYNQLIGSHPTKLIAKATNRQPLYP